MVFRGYWKDYVDENHGEEKLLCKELGVRGCKVFYDRMLDYRYKTDIMLLSLPNHSRVICPIQLTLTEFDPTSRIGLNHQMLELKFMEFMSRFETLPVDHGIFLHIHPSVFVDSNLLSEVIELLDDSK